MFKVLVKQHCDAVTPFSAGYKLDYTNGMYNTFLLAECESVTDAQLALSDILHKKFDAEYDETNECEKVNEELVYFDGDLECIFDGMFFFIDEKKEIKKTNTEWVELSNPIDSDIKLKVSNDEYTLNVKDGVNDLYLQNLDLFYLYDLIVNNNLIGRKVFWLDPCALDDREHTSDWKIITDIEDGVITLDDATEVYISECYM
jgi:hypothetical protein